MDADQLSQELNLKAMTALSSVVADEERGLISKAEAKTAIRAIYEVVGGLVPTSTFDLISAASEQYKHHRGWDVQMVNVAGELKGVARVCGNGAVIRITGAVPHRKPSNNVDETENDLMAKQDASSLLNRIRATAQW